MSTEFTIGMSDRSSSKVLKPPGGGCSDIFGTTEKTEETNSSSQKDAQTKDRLFGPAAPEPAATPTKIDRNKSDIFGTQPQEEPRPCRRKYVQRNPITGEIVEIDLAKNGNKAEKNGEAEDEDTEKNGEQEQKTKEGEVAPAEPEAKAVKPTSVRVRQPPGGKSSGIF